MFSHIQNSEKFTKIMLKGFQLCSRYPTTGLTHLNYVLAIQDAFHKVLKNIIENLSFWVCFVMFKIQKKSLKSLKKQHKLEIIYILQSEEALSFIFCIDN